MTSLMCSRSLALKPLPFPTHYYQTNDGVDYSSISRFLKAHTFLHNLWLIFLESTSEGWQVVFYFFFLSLTIDSPTWAWMVSVGVATNNLSFWLWLELWFMYVLPIATPRPSLLAIFLPQRFHKLSLLATKNTNLPQILEHTLQITLVTSFSLYIGSTQGTIDNQKNWNLWFLS